MSDTIIHIHNISKIYKLYDKPKDRFKEAFHPLRKKFFHEFYALRDASFEIRTGETIGIIGKNGSGKSTLLQIVSGVLSPSSGTVDVRGRISALLELGAGFNPEFSGLDNVYFNGQIMGYSRKEMDDKIDAILAFADIGEFAYQPVKTYSSGMFVRLAFALAINVDPDILIVDEALAVGDAAFQIKCMRRIKDFSDKGKTLLFVSHDPSAVRTLCDYAYLLDKGRIVDYGKPDKVFDYYNSLLGIKKSHDVPEQEKETLRKRSGNNKMEIKKVTMVNQKGVATDTFVSGEKVTITIEVYAHAAVLNPSFGIAIRDRLGNDVFGINNCIMRRDSGIFNSGETHEASYAMSLNIGVNMYDLTVAVHSGETHVDDCYDWINQALIFKVIPSADFHFSGYSRLMPEFMVK